MTARDKERLVRTLQAEIAECHRQTASLHQEIERLHAQLVTLATVQAVDEVAA